MATLLKRLGPTTLTTSAATVGSYTVPTAKTFIVRHIGVSSIVATQQKFTLSIGTDATGTRVFMDVPVTKEQPFDWSGFMVVVAAEFLQAKADLASSLNLVISGTEIDA